MLEVERFHREELLRNIGEDPPPFSIKGETCLEVYPGDVPVVELGDVRVDPCEKQLVSKTEWEHNVIVDSISTLLGALFRGETGYSGIQYVVVGSGQVSWDADGVPDATAAQTDMVSELARVAATVSYLDSANALSLTPTSRLSISGVFTSTLGNESWREWGIVGGNATAVADSGLLIDYRTNELVNKTSSDTFLRRVRLSF